MTSSATSRRRCPSATATQMREPPPASRDHRDGRGKPARRPRGDDVRVPPRRGDRRAGVAPRARVRRGARGLSGCATFWAGGRGARQPASTRGDAARDADRRAPAGRARDALARRGRKPTRDRHRGARSRDIAPGAADAVAALPDLLDDDDRARDGLAPSTNCSPPASRTARPTRVAADAVGAAGVRHRRDRGRATPAIRRSSGDYFTLGARLKLNWLRDRIIELPRNNRWQALARAALRDDLNSLSAHSPRRCSRPAGTDATSEEAVAAWEEGHGVAVERCLEHARRHPGLRNLRHDDAAGRLREVRNLVRAASGASANVDESLSVGVAASVD